MISSMKYLKPLRGWCPLVSADMPTASVPLMADVTASERLVKRELAFGKVLYLAYSSNDMLERYNAVAAVFVLSFYCPLSTIVPRSFLRYIRAIRVYF